MQERLTTIRSKHLESCSSYEPDPPSKPSHVRRRHRLTTVSAKSISDVKAKGQQQLQKSIFQHRSDKNIRGRILLPKSKHLPKNFFDEKVFLKLDRCCTKNTQYPSPADSNVQTPTFRDLGEITFCEQSTKIEQPKHLDRKFGKSEVFNRKLVNDNKQNQPFLANRNVDPKQSLRTSITGRSRKNSSNRTIFQPPKISDFEGDNQQFPSRLRLATNPSQGKSKIRLKLNSYLPQLKLRLIQ